MSQPIERIKVLSAGIASLILMLGIARFAYWRSSLNALMSYSTILL